MKSNVIALVAGLALSGSALAQSSCPLSAKSCDGEKAQACETAKTCDSGVALQTAAHETMEGGTIVETAVKAGNFKTLAAALTAAGLIETLNGKGPFTVFAPTDEAFAKLPAGTVEELLKPQNKDKLIGILTYHVVPGNVLAGDVVKLTAADTVNGQRVAIKAKDGAVMIDGAKVTTTDIKCTNGTIHVIDSVILPSDKTVVQTAVDAGSFKTLAAALEAAGLVSTLEGDGPFTVFAPTDEAFKKLPAGLLEALLKPENRATLTSILTYHVVAGRVFSDGAVKAGTAKTIQGSPVTIAVKDGQAMVDNAKLVTLDLDASNGVIHVIDTVILPKGLDVSKLISKK